MKERAKNKAEELVEKFEKQSYVDMYGTTTSAIQCALICVEKIIEALDNHQWQNKEVIQEYQEVKEQLKQM